MTQNLPELIGRLGEPAWLLEGDRADKIDENLLEILKAVESLVANLDGALEDTSPRGTVGAERLCAWVEIIEEVRRVLAGLVPDINRDLADRLPNNTPQHDIPSVPVLKWGAPRRKWDNDALLSAVTRRIVHDATEAGIEEEHIPTITSTLTAISHVYNLAGSSARLKALEDLYIDPDEYCEKLPATPRIQFLNR